jgi:hypothetical protein
MIWDRSGVVVEQSKRCRGGFFVGLERRFWEDSKALAIPCSCSGRGAGCWMCLGGAWWMDYGLRMGACRAQMEDGLRQDWGLLVVFKLRTYHSKGQTYLCLFAK